MTESSVKRDHRGEAARAVGSPWLALTVATLLLGLLVLLTISTTTHVDVAVAGLATPREMHVGDPGR